MSLRNEIERAETIDEIIHAIEKRIDSIKYAQGMEYHCCAAVQYAKDKMKEMLK